MILIHVLSGLLWLKSQNFISASFWGLGCWIFLHAQKIDSSACQKLKICVGLLEGVIGLVSSRIGVNSNDPPCSHDWVAWVATEGTSSKGELSIASPTGYGLTREDPLRGEVEDAAELEMGIAAAWASRALSLGTSKASVRFGDLSETA